MRRDIDVNFNEEVNEIIAAGQDKKAFDIKVIDIKGVSSIADYFVIMSGTSDRQVVSIADEIEDRLSKTGLETINKEGRQEGKWIILDYGDVIVHVFQKSEREFYNLEKLWIDSKSYDIA